MLGLPGARRNSGYPRDIAGKPGSGRSESGLWTEFWQEFCPKNVPHERCHIPGDGRSVVDRHWADFAEAIPAAADVIDLGCGTGIAGRTLLGIRSDLRVAGVDFADVPIPMAVENLTIHRWVAMEALPFEDGCFDAGISLFGIEYGDVGRTAPELGRVLRPGGHFSFLVHHAESELVREGATRRKALRELLSGKVKAPFLAGSFAGLDQQLKGLRKQFPDEPSIRLFANWLSRDVKRTRAQRHSAWHNLRDGLDPEIALLTLLQRSAKSAADMGVWLGPLISVMGRVGVSVLRHKSGGPIAWQVGGIR